MGVLPADCAFVAEVTAEHLPPVSRRHPMVVRADLLTHRLERSRCWQRLNIILLGPTPLATHNILSEQVMQDTGGAYDTNSIFGFHVEWFQKTPETLNHDAKSIFYDPACPGEAIVK